MACGRPKNLENAGRNLLCGCRDRRRNFFTTGNGNRRRGNPEPLAEGKPRATRQRATSGHWQGAARRYRRRGNSAPLVRGRPRTTRQWAVPGPLATEGPGAIRQGGNPGPARHREKLQSLWRRGNPEPARRRKPWATPAKGKLEPFGLGETPAKWRKESSEPPGEGNTGIHPAWGKPRPVGT